MSKVRLIFLEYIFMFFVGVEAIKVLHSTSDAFVKKKRILPGENLGENV